MTLRIRDSLTEQTAAKNNFYIDLDGKIPYSSDKCHETVASGDFYAGLTFEKAAVQYKDDPDLGFVYPDDGTSAVPDGVALLKKIYLKNLMI